MNAPTSSRSLPTVAAQSQSAQAAHVVTLASFAAVLFVLGLFLSVLLQYEVEPGNWIVPIGAILSFGAVVLDKLAPNLRMWVAGAALLLLCALLWCFSKVVGPWKHDITFEIADPRDEGLSPALRMYDETYRLRAGDYVLVALWGADWQALLTCGFMNPDGSFAALGQPRFQGLTGVICPGAREGYQPPPEVDSEKESNALGLQCKVPLVGLQESPDETGLVNCGVIRGCRQAVAHFSGTALTGAEIQFVFNAGADGIDRIYPLKPGFFSFDPAIDSGEAGNVQVNLRVRKGKVQFAGSDLLLVTEGRLPRKALNRFERCRDIEVSPPN